MPIILFATVVYKFVVLMHDCSKRYTFGRSRIAFAREYKTDVFCGIYRGENRDKARREAAFYSGDACENTTPREPRKYSNTRVPRRQPLGSVVTCPVIYGCNTAATLLFVVFTHISRSPAGRDRSARARAPETPRDEKPW